jgi:hypothetical protein
MIGAIVGKGIGMMIEIDKEMQPESDGERRLRRERQSERDREIRDSKPEETRRPSRANSQVFGSLQQKLIVMRN